MIRKQTRVAASQNDNKFSFGLRIFLSEKKSLKGVMFTFDSLFALLLVATIIPLILLFPSNPEIATQSVSFQAESAVDSFSKLTVRNLINEPVIAYLYSQNKIGSADLDRPVIEIIAQLWSSNDTANGTIARNITEKIVSSLLPNNTKWAVSLEGDTLFDTGGAIKKTSVTGRRVASGYIKGSESEGFVASLFLTSLGGKKASSYFFFGGFVGQGNITLKMSDIVNGSNVSDIYMEMNAGDNFTLYANSIPCGTFTVTPGNFSVDNWSVPSCTPFIYPAAENNLSINFTGGNITNAFIGGGYIRVTYSTSNLLENSSVRYRFPGINGLINLYDSFHVPGNITGMTATMKFFAPANYTTILNIGNVTVINSNGTGSDTTMVLDNATLAGMLAAKGINFIDLSDKTVPVRMFVGANITGGTVNGTADVVLITDTSGSMAWRLNQDGVNGVTITDCSNPAIYDATTSRISLAKCLDKTFVNALLGGNSSCGITGGGGNRIALVSFSSSANNWESLTTDINYLESRIDAYPASGSTCVSCAINRAYDILSSESTQARTKYIIVMTDGVANIRSTSACYDMNGVSEGIAVGESVYASRSPPWIGGASPGAMNSVDVYGSVVRAAADGGEIYRWTGSAWTLDQDMGSSNIYGIDIFNDTLGFATGASGKIYAWDGAGWNEINDFGNFNFRDVNIFNSTLGFIVGDSGRIYRWDGVSWSSYDDVGSANLYGVAVQSGGLAFAAGTSGKIYIWDGAGWSEMTDTGNNVHYDVAFVNSSKAFTASSSGRIYEWNGGSWTNIQISSYDIFGIHVSGGIAYAVGDGRGDVYEWDGSWSRTYSSFYYNGTFTSGLDCGDDDACSLSVSESYPALNANYSAARARQDLSNLTIDSVGFGPIGSCTIGNQTIVEIAKTGNGTSYSSASGSELAGIYCQLANNILTKATQTQQIITVGTLQPSVLYDSYIDFDYTPSAPAAYYQEISINSETPVSGCTVSFFVPSNIRILDALRTSYSGFFWTKTASVQNSAPSVVYNLSSFGSVYTNLGDPFRINLPVSRLFLGETNNVTVELGLNTSFSNATCSGRDRVIYNARMRASAPFGAVFPKMSGGIVRVYYDTDHDGAADGYNDVTFGQGLPNFDPAVRTVNQLDPQNALHDAMLRLLASLNLVAGVGLPGEITNPVDVSLGEIAVDATGTGGIPFAWGPIDVRLDVKI